MIELLEAIISDKIAMAKKKMILTGAVSEQTPQTRLRGRSRPRSCKGGCYQPPPWFNGDRGTKDGGVGAEDDVYDNDLVDLSHLEGHSVEDHTEKHRDEDVGAEEEREQGNRGHSVAGKYIFFSSKYIQQ